MTNRFNLIDEPWIPAAGLGRVSLRRLFTEPFPVTLGGTALPKIALLKFLPALCQVAATPTDDREWLTLGPYGLAKRCLEYLEQQYDAFWLYGEKPFLQIKACSKAELKPYGMLMPHIATGNTPVLSHQQLEPDLDDADKALLLIEQMSLCFGGKKPSQKLVLTPGYEKKASARPGPALCHMGLLHSFLLGRSLPETLWLNLLTREDIADQKQWENGLGVPPWEQLPQGEDCPAARALKSSLMGRLVPLARFCLLEDKGLRFTEGIIHPDYQTGMADPSTAMDASKAKIRMLWTDPEKRPWRQLPALLSFLDAEKNTGFYCLGLKKGISRVKDSNVTEFGIWCGGVRVSSNAGEQYLTGTDDELESEFWLETMAMNQIWFRAFEDMMGKLEKYSQILYVAVSGYGKGMGMDGKNHAAQAAGLFWQAVEPLFPVIIEVCEDEDKRTAQLRICASLVSHIYDQSCAHGTPRQFEHWIRHRPFSGVKRDE